MPKPDSNAGMVGSYAAVFVGRARELRELDSALDAALASRGALLLVGGEPGAGKTTLVQHFAARAAAQGVLVAWGRASEGDAPPPLWPWAQVLRVVLGGRRLEEAFPDRGTDERELIHALVELRAPVRFAEGLDAPGQSRFLLFDAVARLLCDESRRQPLLLAFDDLQDADVSSLLLLRFLGDRVAGNRILALGLVRDADPAVHASTARCLRELTSRAPLVPVRGLSDADVRALYRARCGRDVGEVVERNLTWVTGRNALFVDEMIRAVATEGEGYPLRAPGSLPVTDRAREAIRRRLESLPEESREVLRVASVLGPGFRVDLLARLLRRAPEDVTAAVARLEAVHLLEGMAGSSGTRRFVHALFRDTLYADLPAAERAALHRRAAEILEEEAGSEGPDRHLADLAHHWWAVRPSGDDLAKARRYLLLAADAAMSRLAWEEAAELYRRAIESASPTEPETADALLSLGDASWRAGDVAESRHAFERAASVARAIGDARRLARAALGCGAGLGAPYVSPGPDPPLVDLLEEVLAALPESDDPLRVRCLARLTVALHHANAGESRQAALADEAIGMAERLGAPELRLTALFARHVAVGGLDAPSERLETTAEMLELAAASGNRELAYWAHDFRLDVALESGEFPTVVREIDRCEALARELPLPLLQWRVATLRAMRALLEGALPQAEAEATRARDIGDRARSDVVSTAFTGQMLVIRWLEGRLREIEPEVRACSERLPWSRGWRATLAWIYAETGRAADARVELERLGAQGLTAGPRDGTWGTRILALSMVASSLGDAGVAAELHDAIEPFAERHFTSGGVLASWGAASASLGILCGVLGRLDDADRWFRAAVAANQRLGNRPFMALALREHAAMLLRRGSSDDRSEALRVLDEALLLMREHGFGGLVARALALREEAARGAPASPRQHDENVIRREGDTWTLRFEGSAIRLRDTKGLRYLAYLMARPGLEVHAMDLVSEIEATGDGSRSAHPPLKLEALDARARRELRTRAAELEEELHEAEARNDLGALEKAREELAFLTDEVEGAYGLGGRPRSTADPAERARKAVTERIRSALARIEKENRALARYLARSVRTGAFCMFTPERDEVWRS